ncbi:hypothetical protein C366_04051 [Cryptococcus neoformans Tu401-1]|nr:hypothetical protein C366_04051 [Cryptococcus neoformans var. grubii Tu401-1]OXM78099.1 hypothetical protein C364_04034 [Cryptococcus neoformans var. grubii Bt63]
MHNHPENIDWEMNMVDDPLEEAANLESTFYSEGYDSGHAHGRLHGLFEGRELGKEKAWELWEEVGYYEGWAEMWVELLGTKVASATQGRSRKGKEARALGHAQTLLELIKTFPITNPTPSYRSDRVPESAATEEDVSSPSSAPATDLASLLSLIRARYRLLCASLSVRPRLTSAVIVEANPGSGAAAAASPGIVDDGQFAEGVVQGIEGPMKGVDTRQLRF